MHIDLQELNRLMQAVEREQCMKLREIRRLAEWAAEQVGVGGVVLRGAGLGGVGGPKGLGEARP